MKCKSCKYWGKNRSGVPDAETRLKTCSCPAMHYGYRLKDEDVKDDEVRAEADEGWGMVTGPDFGCVHFVQEATATRDAEAGQRIVFNLMSLSEAERTEVFSNFCLHCGSDNPRCQCWNDE